MEPFDIIEVFEWVLQGSCNIAGMNGVIIGLPIVDGFIDLANSNLLL
jgi:hypothetical protein